MSTASPAAAVSIDDIRAWRAAHPDAEWSDCRDALLGALARSVTPQQRRAFSKRVADHYRRSPPATASGPRAPSPAPAPARAAPAPAAPPRSGVDPFGDTPTVGHVEHLDPEGFMLWQLRQLEAAVVDGNPSSVAYVQAVRGCAAVHAELCKWRAEQADERARNRDLEQVIEDFRDDWAQLPLTVRDRIRDIVLEGD